MFVDLVNKRFSTEDVSKNLSMEIQACIWATYKRAVELGGLNYKEPQPVILRNGIGSIITSSSSKAKLTVEFPKKKKKPNIYTIQTSHIALKYFNKLDELLITYVEDTDQFVLSYEKEDLTVYGIK